MSAEFDKEAKQEYLDAIRFYGKAAERFSAALAACIQKIQESPTRFRQIAPNIRTCRVEKFPYQLLFTLKEDRVYIIAVKHDRRAPDIVKNASRSNTKGTCDQTRGLQALKDRTLESTPVLHASF
jgi:toxin ParE1/3/4